MFADANNAIEAVHNALRQSATNELLALFLYGSLRRGTYQPDQSDINLMAVFNDDLDLHSLRLVLRPVWQQYGNILRHLPVLLSRSAFDNHIFLNPILAKHLYENAELIDGEQLVGLSSDMKNSSAEAQEYWAWIAGRTMIASSAIAPSLLSEEKKEESLRTLRSLVRQVFGRKVSINEAAVTLIASLMSAISHSLPEKPASRLSEAKISGAPPLIEDLRAIYEVDGWLVLVVPDMPPDQLSDRIVRIDWLTIADTVPKHFRGLRITTPHQLRLILQYDRPADYQLENYQHAWGLDSLVGLEIERWRILRQLARAPSKLLVETFPHDYITTNDSNLSTLIHDLHNKLLNIQLRDELYRRMDRQSGDTVPFVMPDRTAPISDRFDAIEKSLNWWVDQYISAIKMIQLV